MIDCSHPGSEWSHIRVDIVGASVSSGTPSISHLGVLQATLVHPDTHATPPLTPLPALPHPLPLLKPPAIAYTRAHTYNKHTYLIRPHYTAIQGP